jgi:hypothetical protein
VIGRSQLAAQVAANLRAAVARGPGPAPEGQFTNLACWVGNQTLEWEVVMQHAHPIEAGPGQWFCELDLECQAIALELIAEECEDIAHQRRSRRSTLQ